MDLGQLERPWLTEQIEIEPGLKQYIEDVIFGFFKIASNMVDLLIMMSASICSMDPRA